MGVGTDNDALHQKFIEKHSLPFRLSADTDKELVEKFGVWQEKNNFGKKYMGTVRTTFLIDEHGTITDVIAGRKVKTKEHAAQILELKLD